MNRLLVTGTALALGLTFASPMLAWSADTQAPTDQTAPANPPGQPGGQDQGGGMGTMGGMQGRQGMGRMGGEGEHRAWMMHGMMRMSPQQRCEERLARRAGVIAYTIAKLNLTAAQRPLWDKVQAPLQDAGNKQRELCATLKSREERTQETVIDRMRRREQFLSAKLQGLQQIRPQMEQFYQSLTPDQKAIIDHPFRHG